MRRRTKKVGLCSSCWECPLSATHEEDCYWPRHVFESRQNDPINSKFGNIIVVPFVVERGLFIGGLACADCVYVIMRARVIFQAWSRPVGKGRRVPWE